jgi:hypothetical protein
MFAELSGSLSFVAMGAVADRLGRHLAGWPNIIIFISWRRQMALTSRPQFWHHLHIEGWEKLGEPKTPNKFHN